jgi:hypothetical protein
MISSIKAIFWPLLIFSIFLSFHVKATETCSRTAIINFQEILVDTTSTQKGEGLRYHLEKDPVAKLYLDQYQTGTQVNWTNAALGSAGTLMLLSGVLLNDDGGSKDQFLIGGAALIAVNFLVAMTLKHSNEDNLEKAVEEYNKRNLPRIYFNPTTSNRRFTPSRPKLMLSYNIGF